MAVLRKLTIKEGPILDIKTFGLDTNIFGMEGYGISKSYAGGTGELEIYDKKRDKRFTVDKEALCEFVRKHKSFDYKRDIQIGIIPISKLKEIIN